MIKKIKKFAYQFLLKSQSFTKSDNIYLVKFGSYLTLGNILTTLIGFITATAFARYLPKEIYGQYRYILSIVALIAIFTLPGMNSALMRSIARGFEKTIQIAGRTKLKWGLLASLTALGWAIYYYTKDNPAFFVSFLIVALVYPLIESKRIYQQYLDGRKRFDARVKYKFLSQLFLSIGLIAAIFYSNNLILIILIYFIIELLSTNFFYRKTLKKYPFNNKTDNETISYGKHLSLMSVIPSISQHIDKIILFSLLGPAQLAVYSFAIAPIRYLRTPLEIIKDLARPKLSAREKKIIKKELPKKIAKISFTLLPLLIILYIIIAPYFFELFFPQYNDSVFFSRIFALDLLVFPASMMQLSMQAQKATKELYKLNVIIPTIKIILLVLLAPFYGIMGIIIARLAANFINVILVYRYFKKF